MNRNQTNGRKKCPVNTKAATERKPLANGGKNNDADMSREGLGQFIREKRLTLSCHPS